MIRYLALTEVIELHRQVIKQSGGKVGLRDLGGLESAVAQPRMTFSGVDLYPTVVEKASTLGFSLVKNHPFVDGNKRTGHAAMEVFLVLNGLEINASVEEQESLILGLASGEIDREEFTNWLRTHIQEKESRIAEVSSMAIVMKYKAQIYITLRPSVLDPAGTAVQSGLKQLGYDNVEQVRIGKYVELIIDADSASQAREQLERMCDQLLANPVIENYRFDLTPIAATSDAGVEA